MNTAQKKQFDSLYCKRGGEVRRQGKAESPIGVLSRALTRICGFYDAPPDNLNHRSLF